MNYVIIEEGVLLFRIKQCDKEINIYALDLKFYDTSNKEFILQDSIKRGISNILLYLNMLRKCPKWHKNGVRCPKQHSWKSWPCRGTYIMLPILVLPCNASPKCVTRSFSLLQAASSVSNAYHKCVQGVTHSQTALRG